MRFNGWRIVWGSTALAAVLAAGALALAPDPSYRWHGWVSGGRYRTYDALFTDAGRSAGVDPLLLKALAWEGSRFQPSHQGAFGQKGLLPLRPEDARRWAAAHRIETFMPTDLFDAQTSTRAAAWVLAQASATWAKADQPETFSLAGYFLGWSALEALPPASRQDAATLLATINPEIRSSIARVQHRRDFYRQHGW